MKKKLCEDLWHNLENMPLDELDLLKPPRRGALPFPLFHKIQNGSAPLHGGKLVNWCSINHNILSKESFCKYEVNTNSLFLMCINRYFYGKGDNYHQN